MLIKHYRPDVWKEIMEMEHHCDKRKNTTIWRRNKMIIEPIIRYDFYNNNLDENLKKHCLLRLAYVDNILRFIYYR